jgi:hypothetical protein
MYKRRGRQSAESNFPYGKSVIGSSGLVLASMLVLAVLADPSSGEIRSPALAWFMLAGVPAAIAALFYGEFRLRNKRTRIGPRQPKQASRIKRPGTEGLDGTREC